MNEELPVEIGQVSTGIAEAGGIERHQFQCFAKGRISGSDHME